MEEKIKLKRVFTAALGVAFAFAVAAFAACAPVEVAEVTLDEATLVLVEGQSATLTATVNPSNATDKTVTWSSDNTEVATVAEGTVTAVKKGTAKITAKAGDKTDGYAFFSQHLTKGIIKNTTFTGIDERPILGCNSTLLNGIVFDGCTFDMGRNSNVTAGSFTFKNCVFNFENTPSGGASNAINVYMQTGDVVIENNTFNLKEGVRGVNFTWANWAQGSYDGSKVSVSGNTFNGTGSCAFRVTERWENLVESDFANNSLNGNVIEIVPKT